MIRLQRDTTTASLKVGPFRWSITSWENWFRVSNSRLGYFELSFSRNDFSARLVWYL